MAFLDDYLADLIRFIDETSTKADYSESDMLRDLSRAQKQVFWDLLRVFGLKLMPTATVDFTVLADQEFYRLPPSFGSFLRFERVDSNGKLTGDRLLARPWNSNDPGIFIRERDGGFRIQPIPTVSSETWRMFFVPLTKQLHYGVPAPVLTAAAGVWTEATKTLSQSGFFADYAFRDGDAIYTLDTYTNAVLGQHRIASRTSDDAVVLADSIKSDGANETGVGFHVFKSDRVIFDSSPTKGSLVSLPDYYVGAKLRVVSGSAAGAVDHVSDYDASTRTATLRYGWPPVGTTVDSVPDLDSVYEVAPVTPDGYEQLLAIRAAMNYHRRKRGQGESESAKRRDYLDLIESARHELAASSLETGGEVVTDGVGLRDEYMTSDMDFWW